jgi:type IV pilus assembly protein PilA
MKKEEGFTLAELLIVVAIIAVLVAIAIPIFTTQLEKSRESTDVANLRSAYAAATVYAMDNKLTAATKKYYDPSVDGSISDNATAKLGQGTAQNGGFDMSTLAAPTSYSPTTEVRQKPIAVQFSASGIVESVNFE